jgi:hypothetical protein
VPESKEPGASGIRIDYFNHGGLSKGMTGIFELTKGELWPIVEEAASEAIASF